LYGIYYAKQTIAKEDNCYLVEGYTDVIQFHQKGIKNVVSSSGTALTPDQIRLINRLTKNITVLFDGDPAGIRAALRGIDLILEQGMNVKICTFPEGEDPDSFAKQNTLEELQAYLKENAKDFIAYKASLLMEEAQNDPVAKANLIRDMVTSISKVTDNIQREIYVRECSRIMDISEGVLFSTLAQMGKKAESDANKSYNQKQKAFEVVKSTEAPIKVDIQYELEQKIIEILLLYGSRKEAFEDLILKENDKGALDLEPVIHEVKVFEKIFLDLQEDEMQFTNENFKTLYYTIIDSLNQTEDFVIESFVNHLDPVLASDVTDILMNEERYNLHNWEKNNIFPKQKDVSIAQLVSETILTLRCFLIDRKVDEIKQDTQDEVDHRTLLEDVLNYSNLKMLLSRKLSRVL